MSDEFHPARDWPVPHPSHDIDHDVWRKGCYACGAISEADLTEPCPNTPAKAERAAARLNQALEMAVAIDRGMVLDLSELPEHVSLMIEGCGTLWWAELRVASEATEGEGATLAEAYNAALKAWKENG